MSFKFIKKIYLKFSGWPPEVKDPKLSEEEINKKKQEYVDKINTIHNFNLVVNDIKYNPGLRFLAKQCLNRFLFDILIFKK